MAWLDYITSGWTLVVVPTAIAIAALYGFVKTLLEKRNLELQNQKLQVEVAAATSRVVLATDEQVEKYAFRHNFMRRTIRLASVLLVVILPASLVFNTVREPPPAGTGTVTEVPPPPPPAPAPPSKSTTTGSLPIGRWAIRGRQDIIAGEHVTEMELLGDGRFTVASNKRSTAVTGRWDGVTGTLRAQGASTVRPTLEIECDLVYVEYKESPQSSYLLGNCTSPMDRWTWEMTPVLESTPR